ncbi:MAG: PAS domain S-box protein, partial [Magnetospirillum sp.]
THCETDDVFWRKDGTSFPVEYVSAPIKDGDEVVGAVVVFRDVTEERRAEEARRRAEAELRVGTARLNLVIDTVKEGVCCFNDEGRIIFANKAAAELLGWPSPKEMQGKAVAEITKHHLADGRPCRDGICRIRLTLDDGETHRVSDEFFSGPDDRLFPVEYVVSPLIVSDVVVGAVVAFHDIGERKAMEKDLQRSNAELEQFAYVASHDLRQPLRMISSYLSMTQKRLGPQLDDETKTFIGFAVDGAKRMDRLILDLLEYSRTGRAARPEPVSLADAVADALDNLTVAIREADADIVVADGLPTVTGTPTELTRLFQNLIGNAVKYRAPERRPRVEIGWRHQGTRWLITVKDNGIGIAPEDRDRAFAIFQRLVPRDAYEGTGIGLAVCKKIVEQHGGKIWIESIPGEGSTFFFTLRNSPAVT